MSGRVTAILVAAGAAVALGALTRVPWEERADAQALVRLSWRARSEAVRACRPPTEEERAGLPAHMQQDSVCERRAVPFRLVVRVDGRAAADEALHGAGARGDRPLYVFREIPVAPGPHRIEVEFRRLEEGGTALRLDETIRLAEGAVALVTLEDDRLVVRQ